MKRAVGESWKVDPLIIEELCNSINVGRYHFVEKFIHSHSDGFFIDAVVFEYFGEYYKFLEIKYLDNEVTYTVPFRVFPKKVVIERTKYLSWVDDEEKFVE